MSTDGRDAYLESEILEADGPKLVRLMYRCALESLGKARRHLARAEVEARCAEITKVSEIVNELALAVDHDSGGELSRNLVELYEYMQGLLQEANFKQTDPPLAEAEKLLGTLQEAWESCDPPSASSPSPSALIAEIADEYVAVDCTG